MQNGGSTDTSRDTTRSAHTHLWEVKHQTRFTQWHQQKDCSRHHRKTSQYTYFRTKSVTQTGASIVSPDDVQRRMKSLLRYIRSTTHEKSPSSEGLSYPKMLKPTIRIERTTCCLRNSCSTTEPRRQMRENITIIRWERQPLWLRNLKEFAAGRQ